MVLLDDGRFAGSDMAEGAVLNRRLVNPGMAIDAILRLSLDGHVVMAIADRDAGGGMAAAGAAALEDRPGAGMAVRARQVLSGRILSVVTTGDRAPRSRGMAG